MSNSPLAEDRRCWGSECGPVAQPADAQAVDSGNDDGELADDVDPVRRESVFRHRESESVSMFSYHESHIGEVRW